MKWKYKSRRVSTVGVGTSVPCVAIVHVDFLIGIINFVMLQSALALFLLSLIVRNLGFYTQSFVYATASMKLLLEALGSMIQSSAIPERVLFYAQVLSRCLLLLLPRLHSYFV
jgi:hypothetical protein